MLVPEDTSVVPESAPDYSIRFPDDVAERDQDAEWFEVLLEGRWRRLRVHDYAELYKHPGLYEALVYKALRCSSPVKVTWLLALILEDHPPALEELRVLDLGAGNGIVADRLRRIGVRHVVGVDLLPEAEVAARRDRPDAYDAYVVADLCAPTTAQEAELEDADFNCLVTVAALGFGDIPPRAFARAVNCVSSPGWVALAIKEEFLTVDEGGFSRLIRTMIAEGVIEVHAQYRYCHRLSLAEERLFYVALVARKLRDIPESMLVRIEGHTGITPWSVGQLITDTLKDEQRG